MLFLRLVCTAVLLFQPGFGDNNNANGGTIAPAHFTPNIIQVGPGRPYDRPSAAAAVAGDGAIIEILAGTYRGDVAIWRQNNLTIRGVYGKARIEANGNNAEGKGIWVIKGNNTTVEDIEFSGVRVRDHNGAGIRQEGKGLTVRRCYFHDNEMGILVGKNPASDIVIEYSEFANNKVSDKYSRIGHNIYVGQVRSFKLRYSYVHHANKGNNVKSRALENYILYNRIADEGTGSLSYAIDLSNGGTSYIIGNVIQQGTNAENWNIISYGAEGLRNPTSDLYVINNTIVNDRDNGRFIKVNSDATPAIIINNIFYGSGKILNGPGETQTSLVISEKSFWGFKFGDPGFVNPDGFDYRLKSTSPAIDKGNDPGTANGFDLKPTAQYVHPADGRKRVIFKSIDIGAYEFVPIE